MKDSLACSQKRVNSRSLETKVVHPQKGLARSLEHHRPGSADSSSSRPPRLFAELRGPNTTKMSAFLCNGGGRVDGAPMLRLHISNSEQCMCRSSKDILQTRMGRSEDMAALKPSVRNDDTRLCNCMCLNAAVYITEIGRKGVKQAELSSDWCCGLGLRVSSDLECTPAACSLRFHTQLEVISNR